MFYSRTLINLSQNDPGLTGPIKFNSIYDKYN